MKDTPESIRVLVANEPLAYREVISAAFKVLRPHVRVHATEPTDLDKEFLRLSPRLVVCSRTTALIEHEAPAWVALYLTVRPAELESETLGLIWLECPYPVMTVGLAKALRAAGYAYCGQKPRGQEPSAVIVCPNGEDVAQEVKHLRDLVSDAPVVVLGLHNDLSVARAAIQAGARGFVHVGMPPEQIAHALSWALKGEIVVPRDLVTALIKGEAPPDLRLLTARQREVLTLVAEGLTNAQIARRLFLTESTVKQHLRGAYKVLGVRNRTEAARLWSNS